MSTRQQGFVLSKEQTEFIKTKVEYLRDKLEKSPSAVLPNTRTKISILITLVELHNIEMKARLNHGRPSQS